MGDLATTPTRGAIRAGSALQPPEGVIAGLALHPQGHRVVSFSADIASGLTLWSLDPPRRLSHLAFPAGLSDLNAELEEAWWPWAWRFHTDAVPPHALQVAHVAANRRGDDFAVAAGRAVRLVRISDDDSDLIDRGFRIPVEHGAAARVALSRDAGRLLVTDTQSYISLWDISGPAESFHCRFRFRISRVAHVLKFLWADRLALAGDDIGRITCWELESGQRHLQFQAHHGTVRDADFCVQQRLLVTAGDDKIARMWDLERGAQSGEDMVHHAPVLSAAFAGGGAFLLTSCSDGRVVVWDTRTCEPLDQLSLGSEPITLATADVRGVAMASRLRALHVLHVDYQALHAVRTGARPSLPTGAHAASMGAPPPRVEPTVGRTDTSAAIGSRMPLEASGEIHLSFFGAPGEVPPRPTDRAQQPTPTVTQHSGLHALPGGVAKLPVSHQTAVLPAINSPPPGMALEPLATVAPSPSYAQPLEASGLHTVARPKEDSGVHKRETVNTGSSPAVPPAAGNRYTDDVPAVVGWARAPEEPREEPPSAAPARVKRSAWKGEGVATLVATAGGLLLGMLLGGLVATHVLGASERQAEVERIETERDNRIEARNQEVEAVQARQDDHLQRMTQRGATPAEIAQARSNAESVLSQRRAEADRDIAVFQSEANQRLEVVHEARLSAAEGGRFNGGLVGGFLGLVLGIAVDVRRRGTQRSAS